MVNSPTPTLRQREARFQQKSIGRELRAFYHNAVAEPPPESFLQLLAEADRMLRWQNPLRSPAR